MFTELRDGYCSHPDPSADPCSSIIAKAHTIQKRGGLTAIAESGQGSPCSPVISNIVGHLLDIRLVRFAKVQKCTYSRYRYADDITFSTITVDTIMGGYMQRIRDSIPPLSVAGTVPVAFDEWSFTDNTVNHEQPIDIIHRRRYRDVGLWRRNGGD